MKRILALLLVLAMAIGLFAGCGKQTPDVTTEPTQTTVVETQPDTQLEKAIEYLRTFYKNAAEKTAMDYTRLGTVRIGITPYEVVWSVDVTEDVLKIVKNEDGTYTIDINEEAIKESTEPTPYVLTATITGKDGRQLSISWNHFVPAAIDQDAIDVIKQAYQLADGETMEGTFTVTGVIKTIDTLYDPSYKNVTVTIEVPGAEDMPIKCYRLKGDGADKLAVGDTITVTGSFTNYKGVVQFAQGCILDAVESGGAAAPVAPEDPKQILREAYALAPGASLPYYCYLTGTITFVDQAYDPNYSNVTVTISTNGYTIKCYRMKGDGADQLNINDIITVGGVITNYNGTIEFGAGCSLTNLVNKEPPAAIADPTPESHVSVKDAYAIGRGKDHNTYTEGKYYVTGTIVSIENDIYGNLHIADGNGNKLMIYGSYSEDGKTRFGDLPTKPTVGQTITVYGAIGRFNSNPQIKNAWIMGVKGTTPVIPDAPSIEQVTEIKAGTPYRFGMTQGNLENAVYYLAGGMNGFYMETTADPAAAINVYVEETAGGYYFYTLSGETKLYINMVVSADGEHVNGAYEATASTVYTYDAAKNTLTATVGGAEYWFGTRNDKTYTTMGPCAVEYAGFFGEFYVGSDEAPNPEEPEDPDAPTGLEEGVAYTISAVNGKGTLWFNGTVSGGRFGGTYTETDAVSVYAENVEGGFLLYFLDGETKQYICIADSTTGGSFGTDATTATIFEWNANKATAAVAEDGNNRGFGVGATSTFDTFSAYDLTGTYNWGQFTAVGGSTEPDEPTCEHENTTVEGAVEATCTAEGHTGKTICSDCDKVVSEGEVIPMLDHSYVDGTCSVCGKTESSEPEVPAEPTVATSLTAGTAYKLGLFSTNKNATYYFTGAMSGYYGATETAYETAIDVFVEEVEGGYHLYFVDTNGAKQYISLVANGSYRNFVFGDAAQSVFTWDAEKTALYTTVEGGVCYIGTYGTYVTMGVLQESMLKDSDYIARLYTLASSEPDVPGTCQHNNTVLQGASEKTCTVHGYTGDVVCLICGEIVEKGTFIPALGHSFANGTCGVCGAADPNYTPDVPEEPAVGLKEGVAYTISAANKTDMLWFNGTITSGRFNGSINKDDAVSVYAENVEGGFLLYFLDGEVKTYICMDDKAAGGRFGTDAATATVYEWNADKNTAAVAVDSNNRAFGCDPAKTYTNFSAYDLSNGSTYNWGQFTEVEGGSTEPDVPACQHVNTELQGKVDATCTVDGYTGDTKCTDCGEIIATGEVIPATGHSFANGTCGVCGEADPNYTPDEPEEPTTGLKEGVAYTISAANKTDMLWFNGTITSGRFNGSINKDDAVSVYAENVEGGFLLYFLDGEVKTYICMDDKAAGGRFGTDAATATVYEWNADKNTAAVAVDSNNRAFGCDPAKTYTNFSAYDLSNGSTYNWGQFTEVEGGSTEPDVPACQHVNTELQGKVDATCTTKGYTGDTVCTDCGESITKGEEIPTIAHTFVDGVCSACGAADPNYTPDEPSTGLDAGKAYKFGMIQKNVSATDVYYLAGGMSSYYMATTKDVNAAIDVYVEATEGGYYFYTLDGETKLYINMVVSGTHVNGAYEAAASTVYTYDAENNTLIAIVNNSEYWFGTRNDKTYTTVGPCAVSYAGFFCQFYDLNAESACKHTNTKVEGTVKATCTTDGYTGDTVCTDCGEVLHKGEISAALGHPFVDGICPKCGEADPNYVPLEPEEIGKAYKLYLDRGEKWYFAGAMDYSSLTTTDNMNAATDVYLEEVEGGFRFYFMDGETKTYIDIYEYETGKVRVRLTTEPTAVFIFNKDLGIYQTAIYTAYVAGAHRFLGASGLGNTIEAWDVKYITGENIGDLGLRYFITSFVEVAGEDPEEPAEEVVTYNVADYEFSTSVGSIIGFKLDDTLTLSAAKAKLYNSSVAELAVYGKQPVVLESTKTISKIVLLARYKDSTIHVETSTDGTNWVYDCEVPFTQVESEVEIVLVNPAKYVRLIQQDTMRFKTMTITYSKGSATPEEPTYEHVIENGGGYAAVLSEDGTSLDCFQFGDEGAIFYTTYFTEKPADSYYEIREYNGKFYYTSAPSWGVIPFESITISGQIAQLKMYDDEGVVELELIAENQYKITTGNGNLPAGLVFTFGAESCDVMGHLGVRNCEEDVKCTRCETVICGPTGHEYGEDGVCFRCFSAMRPEEPEQTGLVVGKAYKFGMIQENVSTTDVYYLAGGMSSYYMATTTDASAAIDVYVEETEGGYYFYTYISGAKTYINMVVSGTHVNGAYEATASTVYTYDAENKTLIAQVNGAPYWFGTRNDKTYTTVGPCATSYNGFFCLFY